MPLRARSAREAPKRKNRPALAGRFFKILLPGALARQEPFALHALALELAVAADRLGPFAGALLAGLLIRAAQLHLPENAFALHFLLQRLQGLVDVVVADDDLQAKAPFWKAGLI